jgi:hypothetical protein
MKHDKARIKEIFNFHSEGESLFHSSQFQDYCCNFCSGDAEKHDEDCLGIEMRKCVEDSEYFEKNYKRVALEIAVGIDYHAVAHYIHFDSCAFCGEEDDHDEDCAMYEMRELVADLWKEHCEKVEAEKAEKERKEKEAKARMERLKRRSENRKKSERKAHEARWAKEAAESGKHVCKYCKRPAANLEAHWAGRNCTRYREKHNLKFVD